MISIIMPVRNALPYLEACLDSIIQQTHTEWQLLAVNDHSSDLSWETLSKYAQKDDRILCFQNNGKGIIDALKTGYSNSTGIYITRMDADDLMPEDKLIKLQKALYQVGEGHVCTGKVKYISNSVLGDGFKKYEAWLNMLCEENTQYSEIYRECVIPSPCWMMHRIDFDQIGGFENETYPEDYDLCFRMYQHKLKVRSSHSILHIWRDHGERASRNDANYSDNRFLDLKVNYYLRIDHNRDKSLILWGAGKKGKRIGQLLIDNNISFNWITNNIKKVGKDIYGIKMKDPKALDDVAQNSSIIIAVANEVEQSEILELIKQQSNNLIPYRFC